MKETKEILAQAKAAAKQVNVLSSEKKNRALEAMAQALLEAEENILHSTTDIELHLPRAFKWKMDSYSTL